MAKIAGKGTRVEQCYVPPGSTSVEQLAQKYRISPQILESLMSGNCPIVCKVEHPERLREEWNNAHCTGKGE